MQFIDAIKAGFKGFFDFSGIANRTQYWLWILFTYAGGTVASILDSFGGVATNDTYITSISVISPLWGLVTFIPTLSFQVRRLRDAGKRVFWAFVPYLFLLTMIIGIIATIAAVVAGLDGIQLTSNGYDPFFLTKQLDEAFANNPDFAFGVIFTIGSVLGAVFFAILVDIVFMLQPTRTAEQGSKYVPPVSP